VQENREALERLAATHRATAEALDVDQKQSATICDVRKVPQNIKKTHEVSGGVDANEEFSSPPPVLVQSGVKAANRQAAKNASKETKATKAEDPRSSTGAVAGKISYLHAAVAKGRKFGCIYTDPPSLYDNQGTRAATSNHYAGLTVDQHRWPETAGKRPAGETPARMAIGSGQREDASTDSPAPFSAKAA
jgi:hypothetical protein